jgi:hypothetical protein
MLQLLAIIASIGIHISLKLLVPTLQHRDARPPACTNILPHGIKNSLLPYDELKPFIRYKPDWTKKRFQAPDSRKEFNDYLQRFFFVVVVVFGVIHLTEGQ